jgi:drug/metabolite transporter (DMT)-like permease
MEVTDPDVLPEWRENLKSYIPGVPTLSKLPSIMLFTASCLWGVCIPIMKALGTEQAILVPSAGSLGGSAASLAARFGLAALTVLLVTRCSPFRIRRAEWKHGAILGAFTAVSMFLQVDGLNYTNASTAGFLIALYSILIPLFTWIVGKRRMTPILALCCLLVLAGMATLTGFDPRSFSLGRGEWENIGAACLFAGQILWVDRVPRDQVDPGRLTLVLCGSVSLACLGALVFLPGGLPVLIESHASLRASGMTLFLAVLGTALPFLIMNRFQSRVEPVAAGFLYCIEPLTAALGAFWLPELLTRNALLYANEDLTMKLAVGGLFILAANLLLLRDKPDAVPERPDFP